VGLRDRSKFALRLGECYVENVFSLTATFQKELERERRLTGTRISFYQIQVIFRKPSLEDLIEPPDSRADSALSMDSLISAQRQRSAALMAAA
jgi:hypothetical protein